MIKSRVHLEDIGKERSSVQPASRAGLARLNAVYNALYFYQVHDIIDARYFVNEISKPFLRYDLVFVFENCIPFGGKSFKKITDLHKIRLLTDLLKTSYPIFRNGDFELVVRNKPSEYIFYDLEKDRLFFDPCAFTYDEEKLNILSNNGYPKKDFVSLKLLLEEEFKVSIDNIEIEEWRDKSFPDKKVVLPFGKTYNEKAVVGSFKYVNFLSNISNILKRAFGARSVLEEKLLNLSDEQIDIEDNLYELKQYLDLPEATKDAYLKYLSNLKKDNP